MAWFRRRRGSERHPEITVDGVDVPAPAPGEGRSFGFKCAWLAVRADEHAEVAEALALRDLEESPWAEGVAAVYEAGAAVFVGGPVDGWVLVPLGSGLAGSDAFDLGELSRRFGEVQRFATHRVVEAHEWERWKDGNPVRRYGYLGESGEVLFNEGEPGEHEEDLLPDADADPDDWEFADEERVMEIAAAWSLDPTLLDERDDIPDTGLLGRR